MRIPIYTLKSLAKALGTTTGYLKNIVLRIRKGEITEWKGYKFFSVGPGKRAVWLAYPKEHDIQLIDDPDANEEDDPGPGYKVVMAKNENPIPEVTRTIVVMKEPENPPEPITHHDIVYKPEPPTQRRGVYDFQEPRVLPPIDKVVRKSYKGFLYDLHFDDVHKSWTAECVDIPIQTFGQHPHEAERDLETQLDKVEKENK